MRNYILVMFLGVILIIAGMHFEDIINGFLGGFLLGAGFVPWFKLSRAETKLRLQLMQNRYEVIP